MFTYNIVHGCKYRQIYTLYMYTFLEIYVYKLLN